MTTPAVETFTTVQERVFEAINRGEDLIVKALHPWAQAVARLVPDLSGLPFADQLPKPAEVVEVSFDLLDKLIANEREFAERLLETLKVEEEATEAVGARKARPGDLEAAPEAKAS